jgi:predicted outer membrane repeat protein
LVGRFAARKKTFTLGAGAGNNHGILEIASDTNVTIQGIGFTGGVSQDGGAIHNGGQLVVTDSAFFQNVASRDGGAIYNEGSLNLQNVDLTLVNNIISVNRRTEQSPSGDDLAARSNATSFANNAFNNYLGDTVICAAFESCSTNNLGINSAFNLRGVSPLLSALQDNGGPTLTHKPQPGSPVIAVANEQVTLFVDQTGRPVVGRRDMGSTESDVKSVPTGVTTFTSAWEASAIGKNQFDAGNDAGIVGVGFDDGPTARFRCSGLIRPAPGRIDPN